MIYVWEFADNEIEACKQSVKITLIGRGACDVQSVTPNRLSFGTVPVMPEPPPILPITVVAPRPDGNLVYRLEPDPLAPFLPKNLRSGTQQGTVDLNIEFDPQSAGEFVSRMFLWNDLEPGCSDSVFVDLEGQTTLLRAVPTEVVFEASELTCSEPPLGTSGSKTSRMTPSATFGSHSTLAASRSHQAMRSRWEVKK